jgi:hypothetical protein
MFREYVNVWWLYLFVDGIDNFKREKTLDFHGSASETRFRVTSSLG